MGFSRRYKKRIYKKHYILGLKWRDFMVLICLLIAAGFAKHGDTATLLPRVVANDGNITCASPRIIDGDTLDCAGVRIRLSGIDAPEMPDHCRKGRKCTAGDPYAARDYLETLSRDGLVCQRIEEDHYGRTVARCESSAGDVSCAMVHAQHAVKRYAPLSCS